MDEEYCDEEAAYWYENDLQLAAELGKTLLERNKELESQLRQTTHYQYEQQREIELLSKQLEVLRNVNDSRMKIYEEVDRTLQDTERANEKLTAEAKADKERSKSLTEVLDALEVRNEELQAKIEKYRLEKLKEKQRTKRTWSEPSLTEAFVGNQSFDANEFQGFPSPDNLMNRTRDNKEIGQLKDSVKILKVQLSTALKKREELEVELSAFVNESRVLKERIDEFERFQEEKRNDSFQQEQKVCQDEIQALCQDCGTRLKVTGMVNKAELIEHDNEEIPRGQLMRLKNGGSAYGSRESLNLIGLETITPSVESCGEILAAAAREAAAEMENLSRNYDDIIPPKKKEVSLLGELEEQYRSLVKKYENLIEAKSNRRIAKEAFTQDNLDIATLATPRDTKGRPTSLFMPRDTPTSGSNPAWRRSLCLDLKSPADPTSGYFENGPPEYKKLFAEIFETLKRSVSYAEGLNKAGEGEDGVSQGD